MRRVGFLLLSAVVMFGAPRAEAAPLYADVIAIVDESGSMSGEHAWLGGMAGALDVALNGEGLTPNRYGLVGFGGSGGHLSGHTHLVGGGEFGTAAEFATAAGTLVISGGTEDGYSGIADANTYGFRGDAARNYILVTDEDRDTLAASPNRASILNFLVNTGTLLNAVVNAQLRCGDGSVALGIDDSGVGYKADGAGGFTTCAGATHLSSAGTTLNDYITLAWDSGGAAWDLNQLRAGGNTATSFTNAFVAVKVEEIQQQPIPEPGLLLLLGTGLVGVLRRRRR